MTTTTHCTARYPVPAGEELAFSALHRDAFLVLVRPAAAPAAEGAGPAVDEVVPAGPGRLVPVEPVTRGFVTMDGVSRLCAALLPVVRREAPQVLDGEDLATGLFATGPYRARQVGLGYQAESVTFAVTRRISRESHQSALTIDRIARMLLRVVRSCPTFRAGLTLSIPDLDRWDRPSVRCLFRLVLLTEPTDALSVVAVAATPETTAGPGSDRPIDRIGPARQRFLARIAADGLVRLQPSGTPPSTALVSGAGGAAELPDDFDDLLLAMGEALVFQNYERVYHLGQHALDRAAGAEQEAQARRLVGIADAQLDEFASAAGHLRRAAALTADPGFAAHLHYLQGLIATKRHYDLEGAEAHYARGLAVLGAGGDGEAPERRVERAWLCNGQALVDTLRAKASTDPATRDRLISSAFDREIRAFALVRGVPGAAPAYLRHNLMANLTFLLEITRRFDEAVRFWRRAFEAYLASDSREFQVAFDARLGLLVFKAGRQDEGIRMLEKARAVCGEAGDRFGEEEICLKLGYAYAAAGDPGRAYEAYADGLRIAYDLREADIRLQAVTGMLWCLAELGAGEEFDALCRTVLRALPGTGLAERLESIVDARHAGDPAGALRRADIAKPMPSPKLRAYIPEVDLEGKPTHDLNRYLVWGEQHAAGGPVPAVGGSDG